MDSDQTIMDRLANTVLQMLRALPTYEISPVPEDYFIFKGHDEDTWLILLFFSDATQLNAAIRSGTCFQIHDFMWYNFGKMEAYRDIHPSIFFEAGPIPDETEQDKTDQLYAKYTEQLIALKEEVGMSNPEVCVCCGHDFDGHQFAGYPAEGEEAPSRGWIMCKEEDCTCFRTWGIEPST